jgi:hypothetical protein
VVDGAGLACEGTIALHFPRRGTLPVAWAGGERWALTDRDTRFKIMSVLSFAGRFYCIVQGNIMVVV